MQVKGIVILLLLLPIVFPQSYQSEFKAEIFVNNIVTNRITIRYTGTGSTENIITNGGTVTQHYSFVNQSYGFVDNTLWNYNTSLETNESGIGKTGSPSGALNSDAICAHINTDTLVVRDNQGELNYSTHELEGLTCVVFQLRKLLMPGEEYTVDINFKSNQVKEVIGIESGSTSGSLELPLNFRWGVRPNKVNIKVVFPKNYVLLTSGRATEIKYENGLIINWILTPSNNRFESSLNFRVNPPVVTYPLTEIGLIGLIIALIIVLYLKITRGKRENKLIFNLLQGTEKEIVDTLTHTEKMTQGQLCKKLGKSKSIVSKAVRKLEEKKMVTREKVNGVIEVRLQKWLK